MHDSFLTYRNFLFLKISLGVSGLAILLYILHSPAGEPNGGTWLGYTLGTIGAGLIGWLLWFGVRKRQYSSSQGDVSGWLSGHVYLGAALLVIATLHCGFQFGWNIHTIAYVLMVLVILSGFFGVFTYLRYPRLLVNNRGGKSIDTLLVEIADIDQEALATARHISDDVHQIILRSIESTSYDQGLWGGSKEALGEAFGDLLQTVNRKVANLTVVGSASTTAVRGNKTVLRVAGKMVEVDSAQQAEGINKLFSLVATRKALVKRVQQDVLYHRLMKEWLVLHVPLSLALLAALFVHIVSVFFYW